MRYFYDDEDEKEQLAQEQEEAREQDANDEAAQADEIADAGRSGASMDIDDENKQEDEDENDNTRRRKKDDKEDDKEDGKEGEDEGKSDQEAAEQGQDAAEQVEQDLEEAKGEVENPTGNMTDMTTGDVPKGADGTPPDTAEAPSEGSPGMETPANEQSLPTDSSAPTGETPGATPLGEGELGPGANPAAMPTGAEGGAAAESGAAAAEGGAAAAEGGAVAAEGGAAAAGGTAAAAEGGAAAGGAAGGGAAGAAGGVAGGAALGYVALIILVILILIGVAGFFLTMPQFLWNKLKQMAVSLWTGFYGYFVGMDEALVQDDDIKAVAQYLHDMGYDLVGMGFAERVTLNERDPQTGKLEDEDLGENQILDIDAPYLKAYLVAENRTYMINNYTFNIADAVSSIFKTGEFFNEGVSTWGTGLIELDQSLTDALAMPLKAIRIGEINVGELIDGVKIERSTNTLRIRRLNFDWFNTHNDYTYYSLKGWSGRYGKPFELSLTLHVATMAPDLVKEIDMNEKLDAKVYVKMRKSDINGKVLVDGKTIDELETEGTYDEDTIKALRDFESKNISEIKTRIPYISSVRNHWFRNVYFEGTDSKGASGNTDIGVDYDEDGVEDYNEDRGPKTQKSKKLSADDSVYTFGGETDTGSFSYSGEDAPDVGDAKITIEGTFSNGVVQTKDAVRGLTNPTTKELFKQKYYIYDGTVEKATQIQEARKRKDDSMKEEVKMTKESLSAFTILETSETLDAQYIYRDLKELVIELGYFERADFDEFEMKVLEWPIPDYYPGDWPNRKIEKQGIEYGTLIACQETVANALGFSVEDLQNLTGDKDEEDEQQRNQDLMKSLKSVLFIGDDYIKGLKESGLIEEDPDNKHFYYKEGKAADYWLDNIAELPAKASKIVVYTGVNNPEDIQVMKDFIDALRKKYENSRIYVVEVLHVGQGYANADELNKQIDLYNSQIRTKCKGLEKVKVLKTAEGLVNKGYLTATSDGFHLNDYNKWATNIAEALLDKSDVSKTEVDEQFVVDFLEYAKEVTNYLRENGFEYGNAEFMPPQEDGTTTKNGEKLANGANMVSWALYKAGFTDVGESGLTVGDKGNFIEYCESKKWRRINDASELQPGDIVFCGKLDDDGKKAKSVYICAGTNKRYDCNSSDRLKLTGSYSSYTEQPFEEGTSGDFMCAYRVKGDRAINSGFRKDLQVISMCNGTIKEIYSEGENTFTDSYLSTLIYGEDLTEEDPDKFKPSEATDEGLRITITDKNLKNYDLVMYGFDVYDGLSVGQELLVGDEIGKTLKSDICLILIDSDKAVKEDIENYIKVPEKQKKSAGVYAAFNEEITEEEMDFLATVLIAENGKNADTMAAVCQVIKNRGNDKVHFNKVSTVFEVLTAPGQYGCVYKVPGSGNGPIPNAPGKGELSPPADADIFDFGEKGKYWVGNNGTPRHATDLSREVAEGVMSGTIEDKASAWLGKLALYQVTLSTYVNKNGQGYIDSQVSQHNLYVDGELYSHDWGSLVGSPESNGCTGDCYI